MIADYDGPELLGGLIAAAFVQDSEAEFGQVEVDGCRQVIDYEKGSDAF
jgi:hypothetical protein